MGYIPASLLTDAFSKTLPSVVQSVIYISTAYSCLSDCFVGVWVAATEFCAY